MKNPLTFRVESYFGGFIVLSVAIFFGTLIYRSAQDMNSEGIIMESQRNQIKIISPAERTLIDEWMKKNNIQVPTGKGYRYIASKYRSKPWLD